MSRRLIALIALLVVLSSAWTYRYVHRIVGERAIAAETERQRAISIRMNERSRIALEREAQQPLDDLAMKHTVPRGYPRPTSLWRSTEKAFYADVLSKGRFDLLVVPFQVQGFAIDRASRSLMTAQLAVAISATGKMKVPDPYVVARALGDGERRLDPSDVYRLAERLAVNRVVWGYVGHDLKYRMRLTIHYQDRDANGKFGMQVPIRARHFDELRFSDEVPPIDVYQTVLPDVLKLLGLNANVLDAPKQMSRAEQAPLPPSPLHMISASVNPADDAYALQVLATLAPAYADRTRERLIEKSMLAIRTMSSDSPEYRALRARALMRLGLRQAAIKSLGTPQTAEEKHLLGLLNGNWPDVREWAPQVGPGLKTFIAKLELNAIAAAFGIQTQQRSVEQARVMNAPGRVWPHLALRAMTDWDS